MCTYSSFSLQITLHWSLGTLSMRRWWMSITKTTCFWTVSSSLMRWRPVRLQSTPTSCGTSALFLLGPKLTRAWSECTRPSVWKSFLWSSTSSSAASCPSSQWSLDAHAARTMERPKSQQFSLPLESSRSNTRVAKIKPHVVRHMHSHMYTHVVMKACRPSITLMQSMLWITFVILEHLYIFCHFCIYIMCRVWMAPFWGTERFFLECLLKFNAWLHLKVWILMSSKLNHKVNLRYFLGLLWFAFVARCFNFVANVPIS